MRSLESSRSSFIIAGLLYLLVGAPLCSAQSGSEYFPQSLGSTWKYLRWDLDSLNQAIPASQMLITDSLTGSALFSGFTGLVIKSYPSVSTDSTIVRTSGDEILFYNGGYPTEALRRISDSLGLGFLPQAEGWYRYLIFGTSVQNNKADTLFRRDSTIFLDGSEFPLTLTITRVRRPPGVVTVPAGEFFSAVQFEITLCVNTYMSTPLGHFAVPLLSLTDTIVVSKNNWIIKEVQGSTHFPLTAIDNDSVPKFRIPGMMRLLETQTLTSVDQHSELPRALAAGQNYPNPFNAGTTIRVSVRSRSFLTIEVVDILGRYIENIARIDLESGDHFFHWNSGDHPSGVYFCRINNGAVTITKKMILQK